MSTMSPHVESKETDRPENLTKSSIRAVARIPFNGATRGTDGGNIAYEA